MLVLHQLVGKSVERTHGEVRNPRNSLGGYSRGLRGYHSVFFRLQ